ncbi:MAG TPA: hypothetical protein ENK85_08555 [Saprospiraceae bacterium]|nr:hypothetical protein [Saprospiraceae bacterium]
MEKVIEALLELIPFAGWLEGMGFSKTKAVGLSVVFVALLVWGIKALLVFLSSHYKNSKAARDMAPYFPIEKVKEARKYYIPTQSQNVSPTREEEPGVDKHVIKSPLISHFLHIFEEKEGGDKFHLVLADSGMGKTTFMINLFVKYHSFFNFKRKYKMKIFPFGDKRIIEKIKEIKP